MKKRNDISYNDFISNLYFDLDYPLMENESLVRNITFQVTDDCCMNCSYCYQGHKGHRIMSKEVARKGVDLLFDMYEKNSSPFINKKTKAIVLDFIGGEPLMAIDIIDYICTYFVQRCLELDHPWLYTWRASMISNGALYFEPKVQEFLQKFKGFVSFAITLDGPKEIHDACRVYHDGRGNFDDAYAAMKHFNSHYYEELGTKVTIAPENLHNLNKIVDFFINEGMNLIHANCVNEAKWTYEHARLFYSELKQMANKLLELDDDTSISLFNENFFAPLGPNDNQNWCGGTAKMLAFDPDGIAYPCLRYMPSSLGNSVPPIIIGSVEGIYVTDEQKAIKEYMESITRRSQSTDECQNCPVASGCSWCSAWNYQETGSVNKRSTNICFMHKACSLANVYYWNRKYSMKGIGAKFKMHLPKEDALKIISEDEYNMLKQLSE